ncbi:hypothetical protein [Pelagicoccus albus]|uniref:Uncharacterized protein n=2 Tax=Pelagicoccus albus TaxID=415222 RepID=A0A7X1B630_9BACT|nr:hypothetical protein [Pelagicoccus albus]MBC2606311.1 hypothetical protein [Pelagicoccus albus]MBC2607426.1 hypothetical protein [Pelagicoccus albus]
MTDPEFNLLSKLETEGMLSIFGRKPEDESVLAYEICERGWASYTGKTKIPERGKIRYLLVNLAITSHGREALGNERKKRAENSVSGVSKTVAKASMKKVGFFISHAITVAITVFVTLLIKDFMDSRKGPQQETQEVHDNETTINE